MATEFHEIGMFEKSKVKTQTTQNEVLGNEIQS